MLLLPEIISKRLGMRVADHQFEDDVVERDSKRYLIEKNHSL